MGFNLRKKYPDFKVLYPDDCHIGTGRKINKILKIKMDKKILGIDNEILI